MQMNSKCSNMVSLVFQGAFNRLDPTGEFINKKIKTIAAGRLGEIPELANLACYLVSDYSSWITGEVLLYLCYLCDCYLYISATVYYTENTMQCWHFSNHFGISFCCIDCSVWWRRVELHGRGVQRPASCAQRDVGHDGSHDPQHQRIISHRYACCRFYVGNCND